MVPVLESLFILAQATQPATVPVLKQMFPAQSVAIEVLVVCLVAATGLAIGAIRFRGFSLGIPGVMFTGLVFGRYFGEQFLSYPVIAFLRDFGLILFVYAVGV